jgi:hypothetical protein
MKPTDLRHVRICQGLAQSAEVRACQVFVRFGVFIARVCYVLAPGPVGRVALLIVGISADGVSRRTQLKRAQDE